MMRVNLLPVLLAALVQTSFALETAVPLGTAGTFSVLAGSTITSTGNTVVDGDLGLSPGTVVNGFPPGIVTNGLMYVADGVASRAQADLTLAYNDAAGRTNANVVGAEIGGAVLYPGLYKALTSLAITTGDLVLDGTGDVNAVFIFQIGSTLATGAGRQVTLTNGASPANIFWQVGSSATLGTTTAFKGTILANISISVLTGATVAGRLLARSGAVTLDSQAIALPPIRPPPPRFTRISRERDGSMLLVISNTPDFEITILLASSLTSSWTFLSTETPGASPYATTDTTTRAVDLRFYKAFYPSVEQ